MNLTEDRVERLWAIEQIKQVKARYFLALDTKDWAGFAALFHPECTAEFAPLWRFETGPDFVAHIRALPLAESAHRGHDPIIELTSDTEARATFGVSDTLRYVDDPDREYNGFGHYHDTFVRVDDQWLFASWSFVRLFGRG